MNITKENLNQLNAEGKISVMIIAADKSKITSESLRARISDMLDFLPDDAYMYWQIVNQELERRNDL